MSRADGSHSTPLAPDGAVGAKNEEQGGVVLGRRDGGTFLKSLNYRETRQKYTLILRLYLFVFILDINTKTIVNRNRLVVVSLVIHHIYFHFQGNS